jgi:GT2 family glycosyltransferase
VWRSVVGRLGVGPQPFAAAARPFEVEGLNGACVLIRAAVFRQVGLLDERLFMYQDEVEFSWRVRQAGWKIMHVPVNSVIHLQPANSGPTTNASFLHRRNAVYVLHKTGHAAEAWVYAGLSLAAFGLRAGLAVWRGKGADYYRCWRRLAAAYAALLTRGELLSFEPQSRHLNHEWTPINAKNLPFR